MDGRTSIWVGVIALTLSSAGCITTQQQSQSNAPSQAAGAAQGREAPQAEAFHRDPKPGTEVKIGEAKEIDADSAEGKKRPDQQAALRDAARLAYQHAIKLDPNCMDAYRHLGMLYAKMGEFDRAVDTLKKGIARSPKDAYLWYDLGQVHNRHKDFKASMTCFYKALEFAPENRDILKTLGFTLAWQGQLDEGFKYLAQAQGAAMAHYNLARMSLQRDPSDGAGNAHKHLIQALQENAQFVEARELLTNMETPLTARR